jgi:6-pyruvoyltetrahydropterin/6-carboxytetrahydropterin synthase
MTFSAEIYREFTFEAAHRLPNVPEGHKCARLHGHSYRIQVHLEGPVGTDTGWVQDFGDIKAAFKPVEAELDHNYLNEIEGLENPTSEVLAEWIWQKLEGELPTLTAVQVRETCTSGCIFRGKSSVRGMALPTAGHDGYVGVSGRQYWGR